MKVAVIGSGYVGLVTGACLSEVGHEVFCVDVDEKKIALLKDGASPIYEPGLEELIKRNIKHERLFFSTDLKESIKGAQIVFIAVGTPEGEDGSADLKYVRQVAENIGKFLTASSIIVVKSTVPVGTCDEVNSIVEKELKSRKVNFSADIVSNPEFLKEGTAIADFMKPDRIVIGVPNENCKASFQELYSNFVSDDPAKLFFVDRRSSEMIKYASNAMLAVRISFMNELSRLCENVGADVDAIRRGMGLDQRIGKKFLWAGPGYGGSCFPKDVSALIKTGAKHGAPLHILEATQDTNEKQKVHVAQKILSYFKDLKGKKIAVWGLAFKPGTDDVREAPALTIVELLLKNGAEVWAHDPEAEETFLRAIGKNANLKFVDEPYDCLPGADALVLVTEWSEYKRPNWEKVGKIMREKVVFDLRNQYSFAELKKYHFHYQCVGRFDDRLMSKNL